MSAGSGCFDPFFGFWRFIAPLIIAAMSMFAFDSTPPVARMRPSGLKASDVTERPIVPADIVPITFVIIAAMSFMFGIVGIWPGLMFPILVTAAIGEDVRSRF